jgi:putative spermidine/putrescine transport system substrate-binding protein
MTPRMLLATALCGALAGSPACARELTVVGRGGDLQQAQDSVFFAPFATTTALHPAVSSWTGGLGILRSRVEGGPYGWDLVLVTGDELLAGCDDGLFDKVAWPALGGRDHYLPIAGSDCGVGAAVTGLVLAWDRDKSPATPTWSDFWDVARYPGKRGLRRGARSNLEIALLADGVAPGDVYRTLRTDDGIDRAFRKLDQIRPYLVWWRNAATAVKFLASGEVLMTSADSVATVLANKATQRHFGLQWAGSLIGVQSWVVMKGSPEGADAVKLLVFMGDPARQATLFDVAPYGPTAKGANELLRPEQVASSPSAPANLAAGLPIDEQFWRDNGDKLNQRFDAWLAH